MNHFSRHCGKGGVGLTNGTRKGFTVVNVNEGEICWSVSKSKSMLGQEV